MKKFQKYLIGLVATVLSFGIFGHVSVTPEVQILGDKVETQLAEYQTINNQFSDLESTIQKIELELAGLEEDYKAANVLADQYTYFQTTLSEAESFNPENNLSDEINALQDAERELKSLKNTQSEILSLYEVAGAENDISNTNTDPTNEITVYWTVNGSVWHRRRDCRGLNRANDRNIRSGTIAQSGKYRECHHSARGR